MPSIESLKTEKSDTTSNWMTENILKWKLCRWKKSVRLSKKKAGSVIPIDLDSWCYSQEKRTRNKVSLVRINKVFLCNPPVLLDLSAAFGQPPNPTTESRTRNQIGIKGSVEDRLHPMNLRNINWFMVTMKHPAIIKLVKESCKVLHLSQYCSHT